MKYNLSGTVLVYTLVLVLLGVFMALATLNLAFKLEAEYKVRQLDTFFSDSIKAKSNLLLKYGKSLNSSGGGFQDIIGCPQDITFSGSSLRVENISTEMRIQNNLLYCQGFFNTESFEIYFNADVTDTFFLEFNGAQIVFNASNPTGTLAVDGGIFIDGTSAFPLLSDTYDDNFDSDNFSISSTGAILYPDGFIDNDANHRFSQFGYIPPLSDWYNIFWVNDEIRQYISENTNNILPPILLGDASEAYVYLDINTDFDIRIIRFDRTRYSDFKELQILDIIESQTTSNSSIGYLQSDLSLGEIITYGPDGSTIASRDITGGEYQFDFSNNDYAIFLRNRKADETLLYQIRLESSAGIPIYSVAIQDHEPAIISMLGNHIVFSDTGAPIGEQLEISQLK